MTRSAEPAEAAASTKVIQRVATVTDREPTRLPPLYETIDPELLDTVVSSAPEDASTVVLRFEFSGCQMTVTGSRTVSVEESTQRDDGFRG